MKKLKLDIQKFSSTNKTSHYNLSQYIGTDKPTYLVDYNADMSAIDTGIYNAQGKADTNETSIGTLSSLTTDAKTNLVSAINEVDSHADTNATNISTNTTNIATNTSAIGTLTNLDTTAKSNLVSAINEVNENVDTANTNINKFNLSVFDTYAYSDLTKTNVTSGNLHINVATNSDGSIAKIYGQGYLELTTPGQDVEVSFQSRLRPTSEFSIEASVIGLGDATGGNSGYLKIKTTGVIEAHIYSASSNDHNLNVIIPPCLYFIKDFGDTPSQ